MPLHNSKQAQGFLVFLLTMINFLNLINVATCDSEPQQIVIFMVDGLLSKLTTAVNMPLVHTFINHGVWDIHSRGDISYSDPKIGWISSLFGITPVQYGCDPLVGCNVIAPEIADPYNIIDVLTDTLDYQANIFSEDPLYTTSIIGDVYSIRPFSTRTHNPEHISNDLSLTTIGNRLVLFHWNQLVSTGFSDGWASSNYFGQVACFDYEIYKLSMALWSYSPNRTTFVLLSDRGGRYFSNRNFHLDTSQIVFAAWGYGVKQPPNINHIAITPSQFPKTILAMVDPDYETDAPTYWNSETISLTLQPNPNLHLNLNNINVPSDLTPPLCIIPNNIPNHTIKIICIIVYILFCILAYQIYKFNLILAI